MTQQQLQTPISLCGKLINALFGASIGDEELMVRALDDAIPLQGASHADVCEYVVEIPMRYAECFALLNDGRKVALKNPRQFVGWSRHDRNRSLLFRSNGKHYEVAVEAELRGQAPGCIRTVFLEAKSERRSSLARKFIGVDGDLVILPVLPATI
ncbi:MAG: hypothetical protein KJO09_01100 [Gammaproteobacteria bacterium]|nr:hypothetical protein [Gammaproteobacteria bacterium]